MTNIVNQMRYNMALRRIIPQFVYAAFLDIKTALDKANHIILFNKLLEIGVHVYNVNIMNKLYSNQNLKVNFNGILSSSFMLRNSGVRYCGILSPYYLIFILIL